jgi:MFS transporter, putative metabolite:H+ symporter
MVTETLGAGVHRKRALTAELISARMERLPFSRFHFRILSIAGACSFFDAFDSLTLSYVLPVLVVLWQFSPTDTGLLISTGYVGQVLGAWGFSWWAERIGRVRAMQWTIALIAILAALCAAAWSFPVLLALRFIQGLGLGGEVPIGATYINEFTNAKTRGRVVFGLQTFFAFAVAMTALVGTIVVPTLGWRWMFILGTIPALLAIPLRRLMPESPRWLAQRVSLEAADKATTQIEQAVIASGVKELAPLPDNIPPIVEKKARIAELFAPAFRSRTFSVWALCFCYASISTAMGAWLPTIYRTIYKLPLASALQYSLATASASFLGACVGIFFIDRLGRRKCFFIAFILGSLPMAYLGLTTVPSSAIEVMILTSLGNFMLAWLIPGFYVYMPEVYPTRMRALGAGVGSSWFRIATIVSPTIIGFLLQTTTISAVFLFFAGIGLVGAAVVYFFVIETRGRVLEEISR